MEAYLDKSPQNLQVVVCDFRVAERPVRVLGKKNKRARVFDFDFPPIQNGVVLINESNDVVFSLSLIKPLTD